MALLKLRLEEVEKSLGEKTLVDELIHYLSSVEQKPTTPPVSFL